MLFFAILSILTHSDALGSKSVIELPPNGYVFTGGGSYASLIRLLS